MLPSVRKLWMTISIKRKIGFFAAMVILIMALSASFKDQRADCNTESRVKDRRRLYVSAENAVWKQDQV